MHKAALLEVTTPHLGASCSVYVKSSIIFQLQKFTRVWIVKHEDMTSLTFTTDTWIRRGTRSGSLMLRSIRSSILNFTALNPNSLREQKENLNQLIWMIHNISKTKIKKIIVLWKFYLIYLQNPNWLVNSYWVGTCSLVPETLGTWNSVVLRLIIMAIMSRLKQNTHLQISPYKSIHKHLTTSN